MLVILYCPEMLSESLRLFAHISKNVFKCQVTERLAVTRSGYVLHYEHALRLRGLPRISISDVEEESSSFHHGESCDLLGKEIFFEKVEENVQKVTENEHCCSCYKGGH